MARCLSVLLLAASFGCGGLDRDVEAFVTITQGVYGQTTFLDDVCPSGCEPQYKSMKLVVSGKTPPQAAVTITSDDKGFFQLGTEPGDFEICTEFDRCIEFTVAANAKIRLDYEMSAGPGWSNP